MNLLPRCSDQGKRGVNHAVCFRGDTRQASGGKVTLLQLSTGFISSVPLCLSLVVIFLVISDIFPIIVWLRRSFTFPMIVYLCLWSSSYCWVPCAVPAAMMGFVLCWKISCGSEGQGNHRKYFILKSHTSSLVLKPQSESYAFFPPFFLFFFFFPFFFLMLMSSELSFLAESLPFPFLDFFRGKQFFPFEGNNCRIDTHLKHAYVNFQKGKNAVQRLHQVCMYLTQGSIVTSIYLLSADK